MQTTQTTQTTQTMQTVQRTTTGDVTTFALGEAVIVYAPATMPHNKPWDQEEWDKQYPYDWPEWKPKPDQEMRKPGCTDEQVQTLKELVFRLKSPTGSLVTLDRLGAYEYSRRTCHESIYCIRQDEVYGQGDPDLLDDDVPVVVNKDLEALFLFVKESVRDDSQGAGQKRKRP